VPKSKIEIIQRIDPKPRLPSTAESAAIATLGGKIFRVDKVALTILNLALPDKTHEAPAASRDRPVGRTACA
jgi:hypothetical protein